MTTFYATSGPFGGSVCDLYPYVYEGVSPYIYIIER